jgi:hypothetical protein
LRVSLVKKRIFQLHHLYQYFADRLEFEKANKVLAKIGYLYKRVEDLEAILQKYGTRETRREHNNKLN